MRTKHLELPSGTTVTVRDPLIGERGVQFILERLAGVTKADDMPALDQRRLAVDLVVHAVVEPKFTLAEPVPEGQVDLDELPLEDLEHLMELTQRELQSRMDRAHPLRRSASAC